MLNASSHSSLILTGANELHSRLATVSADGVLVGDHPRAVSSTPKTSHCKTNSNEESVLSCSWPAGRQDGSPIPHRTGTRPGKETHKTGRNRRDPEQAGRHSAADGRPAVSSLGSGSRLSALHRTRRLGS